MSQYGDQQGQGGYGQQPQYGQGQPQYGGNPQGQPHYGSGQPQYGGNPQGGYVATGPQRSFGIVGAALAVVGAIAGVVAFTAVNWFSGNTNSHFSDIHKVLEASQSKQLASSFSKLYFGWLAWVLLAAAVIGALLAAVPAVSAPFRVIGLIIALGGIAATFVAIKFFNSKAAQISKDFNGYSTYLKHARIGFYLTVAAFLLTGIGAVIGSRRRA